MVFEHLARGKVNASNARELAMRCGLIFSPLASDKEISSLVTSARRLDQGGGISVAKKALLTVAMGYGPSDGPGIDAHFVTCQEVAALDPSTIPGFRESLVRDLHGIAGLAHDPDLSIVSAQLIAWIGSPVFVTARVEEPRRITRNAGRRVQSPGHSESSDEEEALSTVGSGLASGTAPDQASGSRRARQSAVSGDTPHPSGGLSFSYPVAGGASAEDRESGVGARMCLRFSGAFPGSFNWSPGMAQTQMRLRCWLGEQEVNQLEDLMVQFAAGPETGRRDMINALCARCGPFDFVKLMAEGGEINDRLFVDKSAGELVIGNVVVVRLANEARLFEVEWVSSVGDPEAVLREKGVMGEWWLLRGQIPAKALTDRGVQQMKDALRGFVHNPIPAVLDSVLRQKRPVSDLDLLLAPVTPDKSKRLTVRFGGVPPRDDCGSPDQDVGEAGATPVYNTSKLDRNEESRALRTIVGNADRITTLIGLSGKMVAATMYGRVANCLSEGDLDLPACASDMVIRLTGFRFGRLFDSASKETIHLRHFSHRVREFGSVSAIYEALNSLVRVYDAIRTGSPVSSSLFREVFGPLLSALSSGPSGEGLGSMRPALVEKVVSEILAKMGVELGLAGRDELSESELRACLVNVAKVDMVLISSRAVGDLLRGGEGPPRYPKVGGAPTSTRAPAAKTQVQRVARGASSPSSQSGGRRLSPAAGGRTNSDADRHRRGFCYDELLWCHKLAPKGCTIYDCKFSHEIGRASKEELRVAAKGIRDESLKKKLLASIG
jgi:hypothetical protein